MIIKNATRKEIDNALLKANTQFDNNLKFKNIDFVGYTREKNEKYRVTLSVHNSKNPGSRIGHSGKRVAAACWHAYGTFIDALPKVAEVEANGRIISPGDMWYDWNIGSMYQPLFYSEACDCQ